jgi:hypothetical protein
MYISPMLAATQEESLSYQILLLDLRLVRMCVSPVASLL